MTHKRETVFTCDRCGVEERSTSDAWQPSLWRGIGVVSPPLASPDHDSAKRFILCTRCSNELLRWIADGVAEVAHKVAS